MFSGWNLPIYDEVSQTTAKLLGGIIRFVAAFFHVTVFVMTFNGFVVPVFGLPEISALQGFGLIIFYNVMRWDPKPKVDKPITLNNTIGIALYDGFGVIILWLISLFVLGLMR